MDLRIDVFYVEDGPNVTHSVDMICIWNVTKAPQPGTRQHDGLLLYFVRYARHASTR